MEWKNKDAADLAKAVAELIELRTRIYRIYSDDEVFDLLKEAIKRIEDKMKSLNQSSTEEELK